MHSRTSHIPIRPSLTKHVSIGLLFASYVLLAGKPIPASAAANGPSEPASDPAEAAATPEFTLAEQLEDSQSRFLSYYADELYAQALVAARQTLRLARQLYGPRSLEAALALANVATAQSKTGDLSTAAENYKASIALIEDIEGIVSPSLVNPLMGLAATYNATGAYDIGLRTYERALRINHVELGLNNDDQMRIRDGLTESYVGLGDIEDANFQQETQARIVRQEYGDDLNRLLPAIYKLADWYERSNQPDKEALLLQNAVRTVKKVAGDDTAKQVQVLRSLAGAYQRLDMPNESIRLLKRAWRFNEESEQRDPLLRADIEVQLGDFYNSFNDPRDARRYYMSAWAVLEDEGGEQRSELQQEFFSKPTNLWAVDLPRIYPSNSKTDRLLAENPDRFKEGYLNLKFDIDENGRATNIRVIESDPEGLLDKRISYLLGRFLYRPRLENGQPVVTNDLQLNHRFSYLEDKDKDKDKRKSSSAGEDTGDRIEMPGSTN